MGVNVQVIGRLGADAEVKTSARTGKQFLAFRMATDEFKNGNRETAWLNVTDSSDKSLKMAQYLTKGKLINLCGVETVSIYNDKNGSPQISRDIRANFIDFISVGQNQEQQANENNTTATATQASNVTDRVNETISCGTLRRPTETVNVTPTPVVAPTPHPVMSTTSSDDIEDDLPF